MRGVLEREPIAFVEGLPSCRPIKFLRCGVKARGAITGGEWPIEKLRSHILLSRFVTVDKPASRAEQELFLSVATSLPKVRAPDLRRRREDNEPELQYIEGEKRG